MDLREEGLERCEVGVCIEWPLGWENGGKTFAEVVGG